MEATVSMAQLGLDPTETTQDTTTSHTTAQRLTLLLVQFITPEILPLTPSVAHLTQVSMAPDLPLLDHPTTVPLPLDLIHPT